MKHPSEAKKASVINIAFDSGAVMERARIVTLITKKFSANSLGPVETLTVLTELLREITNPVSNIEHPEIVDSCCGKKKTCKCKGKSNE